MTSPQEALLPYKLARPGLVVGPPDLWSSVRDDTFAMLLQHGMNPWSRVLDVGSGVYRIGAPLIGYLDPGCYHAIEPDTAKHELGREFVVDPAIWNHKQPRIDHNSDFDFTVFGEKFDFVLLRSIWTHTPFSEIETCLDMFRETASEDAVMFASHIPPKLWPRRRWPYYGKEWVWSGHWRGTVVAHSTGRIRNAAYTRGLNVDPVKGHLVGQQPWLKITRHSGGHGHE